MSKVAVFIDVCIEMRESTKENITQSAPRISRSSIEKIRNTTCTQCVISRGEGHPGQNNKNNQCCSFFFSLSFRSEHPIEHHRPRPPEVDRRRAKPHWGKPSGKDQGQISTSLEEVGGILQATWDNPKTRGPLQHRGIF